jgi:hypothetical protein
MNNISILEIRKLEFIKKPDYENYKTLSTKIYKHREIFDNRFFSDASKNALAEKDTKGLLFISQLYISLGRNIEAEYVLLCAYDIDNTDDEIVYYLFDIFCRRKQLGFASHFLRQFDKSKNELLFTKSTIKYFLLTKKEKDLNNLIVSCFEKLNSDREFVSLTLITAIQTNNYRLTYLVSKTKYRQKLFFGLSGQDEHRLKRHFYKIIINLLKEKVNGHKSC